MNPRNPIDDLFRRRLEEHESASPMHLWTEIDRRRHWRRRMRVQARRHWLVLLLMLLLFSSTLAGILLWPDTAPPVRSFPIPTPGSPEAKAWQPAEPVRPQLRPMPPMPPAPIYKANRNSKPAALLPAIASSKPAPQEIGAPAAPTNSITPLPETYAAAPPKAPKTHFFGAASLPKVVMEPLPRDPQCVRFGQHRHWRLYADMHVGPAAQLRRLEADNPEYDDYAAARRETETPQLSFTTGARFSLVSPFGAALRSGLQFTQYNEHFDFTDNSKEKITITNVYGPNGEIIGTDTLIEMGAHHAMASNNYQILDVPILLGYEWRKNNWTVAFNGGALINVLFDARGDFLSPDDLSPVGFSNDDSSTYPAYRKEIGIGWYAGIGIHYKLQEDLQFLLEPHFRINPQSVTRDEYVLDQRYMSMGLSVGLRKQL
jgi:hypothetical protein